MLTPLLSIKLKIPPCRSTLVLRPHLIERLNAGLNCKLSLISAPAGYGKTMLLCSWVSHCQRPTAWISLDKGDNDPGRFLHYLTSALRQIKPNIGDVPLSTQEPWRTIRVEAALTSLLNEIADMPGAAILILDDYQNIGNQRVHDAVTFLLDHLPPQLHVAISTRSDPPLPIARLRAHGELAELRQTDLRFSADETAQFLTEFIQRQLSAEDVNALVSRTEGWITGLHMAALSLQHQANASEFIAKFTGGQHHVLDYLIEEVLARQPERVQAFLLRTSILERMTGSLCDEVAFDHTPALSDERKRERSGQAMLEHLEHANLFVFPLDEELQWYRYHHLFADCLRQHLCQTEPQLVPELHRRAANWYQRNSDVVEAVDHLLAAGDWMEAAQLVEQQAMQLFIQGEMSSLSAWLDRLPEDLILNRPWLCVLNAWVCIFGRHESSESCLQAAETALKQQKQWAAQLAQDTERTLPENQLRAHMSIIRAILATATGDPVHASDFAQQALEHLPGENLEHVLAALIQGWAARLRGDLEGANRSYAEARRVGLVAGCTHAAMSAICCLGDNQVLQGQLRKAAESYQEALRLAVSRQAQDSTATGYTLLRLGDVYREWNDLETALRHVVDGINLCKSGAYTSDWALGFVTLARIHLARNNLDEAQDALQNAWQLTAAPLGDFVTHYSLQDCQVRLWLACGNLAAATRWRHARGADVADGESFSRELEHITLARVLMAQGQFRPSGSDLADAVSLLTRVLNRVESMGWMAIAIEAMILQALALQLQGHVEHALTVLTRALTVAKPEGYVRVFVDEGTPMAKLLRQVAVTGPAADYVGRLLAVFGKRETGPFHRAQAQDPSHTLPQIKQIIEALSVREFDVLRLLPTGLSGSAIADELCISANTVRTHIRHIYGKLNVHSRYEAVQRAKELDLI